MRVLLDITFALLAPHSGTGIYLDRLQAALAERNEISVLAVANGSRRAPGRGGLRSVRNALADADWVQRRLPRLAARHHADVIHHPLPALAHDAGRAQAITVHDLAFLAHPGAFDPAFRAWAAWNHGRAARGADAVICVSNATRREAQALWDVSTHRITVAPHGPGQQLPPVSRTVPRHFLYVGDGEPRKNLPLLLTAYAHYRRETRSPALELVLAGGAVGHAPGVRLERDPNAQRLAVLHAQAAALVHPARHEGFGLTLLEAMAAGTPVLAIAGGAVTEVCGDAAWLLPGPDPGRLAAALGRLATDPTRRDQLTRAGHRRVADFSWERCAAAHAEAYARALAAYPSALRR